MKILTLTRYDRQAGSSRLRTMQYLPFWQAGDVHADCFPLLDNQYLNALYSKRPINKWSIIKAYFMRLLHLLHYKKYDLLWIEKELFPWLPAIAEHLLGWLKIPYVVDYDDAVFHHYDMHTKAVIRFALGKKIDQVMRKASLVVVGNEYLAKRAAIAGAKEIAVIPTVIDLERYPQSIDEAATTEQNALYVGWIGNPATFCLLQGLMDVLVPVLQQYNAKLLVVGVKNQGLSNLPIEWLDWREDTEVQAIQRMSVGIMPLRDVPFEHGKCGYKLIQYMACSKPVVASPIGVNSQIVSHGNNGFLASTKEQWQQALSQLLSDAKLRQAMGKQGRLLVEQKYCLQITAPQVINLLKKCVQHA